MLKKCQGALLAISIAYLGAACTDTEGRLGDFAQRVTDANTNTVDAEELTSIPNVTGDFFFNLDPSAFPGKVFKFRATITLIDGTTDEPKIRVVLQPLDVNNNSDVGAPIVTMPEITPVNPNTGEFAARIVAVIPGEANPVSGSMLTIDAVLNGVTRSADFLCGDGTGGVIEPFELNLDGSTWGAVRIPEGDTVNDVTAVSICIDSGDNADAGVPDAG